MQMRSEAKLTEYELEQNKLASDRLFVVRRREDRDLAAKARDNAKDQYKWSSERPTEAHRHQQLRLDLFAAERKLADAEVALTNAVVDFNARWNGPDAPSAEPTTTETFYERGGGSGKFGGT